eukprot:5970840-Alexandrium_andersonii.AAC.1
MRIRSGDKVVRNEPTMRQQQTQCGVITCAVLYAVQQDEQQPRRELMRNKTGHSGRRRGTMNDNFTKRAFDDPTFRRHSGL